MNLFLIHTITALYGCETWLLTIREEKRYGASEISLLSRIFRPERDEVRGE
jgi:hypothetical protein